jgi:hypothetical protein
MFTVEIELPESMRLGRDVHDPCRLTLPETIEQQVSQQEGCQVVDCHRGLDAIDRFAETCVEEPGIVEQHVDLRVTPQQRRRERADLLLGSEIRDEGVDPVVSRRRLDLRDGALALLAAAAVDGDAGAPPGQFERGSPADPRRRAGNDADTILHHRSRLAP